MIAIAHGFGGDFTAAEFRDKLDNGRKVAILILEFFDRHGITIRRGDLRRTVPQKLAQFGPPPRRCRSRGVTALGFCPMIENGGKRSRWGGWPSKPERAVRRFLVGSNFHSLPPTLIRYCPKSLDNAQPMATPKRQVALGVPSQTLGSYPRMLIEIVVRKAKAPAKLTKLNDERGLYLRRLDHKRS